MINGINSVNPLNNVQDIRKTEKTAKTNADFDSIQVSKEAIEKAESYYLDKVAAETPNTRADKIAEVKAKLQDPSYLSDAVIMSTADKFLTSLGL